MLRTGFLVAAALAMPLISTADPPAPPQNPAVPAPYVGKWTVSFSNGVIEICAIKADGTAFEREPNRASEGKVEASENSVIITFADDRVERWTLVDKRVVVEHWCPAQAYPGGKSVLGIADRMQ